MNPAEFQNSLKQVFQVVFRKYQGSGFIEKVLNNLLKTVVPSEENKEVTPEAPKLAPLPTAAPQQQMSTSNNSAMQQQSQSSTVENQAYTGKKALFAVL